MRTLLAVILLSTSLFAEQPPTITWKAHWITCPNAPAREAGVYRFRKVVNLASVPKEFNVHVSADNRFVLYVNGQRIGEGPARGDLFHWRYETFDLAPALKPGDNVVSAIVWNFGSRAPLAQMSNRTGFLVQGTTPESEALNTDDTWEAKPEPGHSFVEYPENFEGYFVAGPGERIDGRTWDWNANSLDPNWRRGWQWSVSSPDPARWWQRAVYAADGRDAEYRSRAAERNIPDNPNAWFLTPNGLPKMTYEGVLYGWIVRSENLVIPGITSRANPLEVSPNKTATLTVDRKTLTTAYPELTISGGRDAVIRVTYTEAPSDDKGNKGNRNDPADKTVRGITDEFISDGGRNRVFMPLWWRTWRYVQLQITTKDQPLTINSFRGYETKYPFDLKARFTSSDPTLAKIWYVGWRTAQLCAHETYVDTPYWEQLQYVGDTRIQALISYVSTGDDRLARQAIDAFDYSRTSEGITQSRYPSALQQYIPPFSLLYIGMLHDFWMYRDDPQFVRDKLMGTRTILDWYRKHQHVDGLLQYMPWWNFVDWAPNWKQPYFGTPPQEKDGGSSILALQYVSALREAADMEQALGDKQLALDYRKRADQLAATIYKLCWDAKRKLLADTTAKTSFSQHANILGTITDTIPREQHQLVLGSILSNQNPDLHQASYYFRFYLARALDHAGVDDLYVDLLDPWRKMLDLGLSTWAETPEPTRSDSHAWSAHPNYDLLTLVAGIRPGSPGFKSVVIAPDLGQLKNVEAAMPHTQGDIAVSFTRREGDVLAVITMPPELAGELRWNGRVIPLRAGRQEVTLAIGN
jgi:alpha-L-rhamnosidase